MKMKTNNKTFPIVGMHCASCAKLIERKLARTPGVTEAQVNYGSETAMINCDDSVSDKDLEDCFRKFEKKVESDSSWVKADELKSLDLSAKNPNGKGDIEHKSPKELLDSIKSNEFKIDKLITEIRSHLK